MSRFVFFSSVNNGNTYPTNDIATIQRELTTFNDSLQNDFIKKQKRFENLAIPATILLFGSMISIPAGLTIAAGCIHPVLAAIVLTSYIGHEVKTGFRGSYSGQIATGVKNCLDNSTRHWRYQIEDYYVFMDLETHSNSTIKFTTNRLAKTNPDLYRKCIQILEENNIQDIHCSNKFIAEKHHIHSPKILIEDLISQLNEISYKQSHSHLAKTAPSI